VVICGPVVRAIRGVEAFTNHDGVRDPGSAQVCCDLAGALRCERVRNLRGTAADATWSGKEPHSRARESLEDR